MLITIPLYLQEKQLLKKIDNLSYAKYIQCEYQERNEIEILSNVLIYVTKGRKILHFPFGDKEISAGDILFLKSGHYVVSEVMDDGYEALLFFYSDTLLNDFIYKHKIKMPLFKGKKELLVLQNNKQFQNALVSIVSYFEDSEFDNSTLLQLKFEEIFLHLYHSKNKKEFVEFLSSLENEESIFKMMIEQNYKEFGSVSQMAQSLKMSDAMLRKRFQKVFDTTPKKYLLAKKLSYAKVLLESSSLNVSQVAQKVGFNDLSWFSQVFKKEFAFTPKECKNNKK